MPLDVSRSCLPAVKISPPRSMRAFPTCAMHRSTGFLPCVWTAAGLISDIAMAALKHLSTIDTTTILDLMAVLPQPESPYFPEQAFGLLLLLDQAPRSLLGGVDERWQVSYFDPLTLKLVKHFETLPYGLRPDSKARWIDEKGYDF